MRRVLVTGGCGWLGAACVRAARARGYQVRCFDLPSRANRLRALRLGRGVETCWGDLRDEAALAKAAADQDAVVHFAAVLYPATELHPARAAAVNVEGTRTLLRVLGRHAERPLIVYPSSVSAYGPCQDQDPPRRVSELLRPTDHYTRHKAAGEQMVRESGLPWSILRVGVALDPAQLRVHPLVLRTLLNVSPDCRFEYVHPEDVGAAVAGVLDHPNARDRVLNIGGGPTCQVRMRDVLATFLEAVGVPPLSDAAYGTDAYYTDWLDTEESERLLRYQRHTFEDFRQECRRALLPMRLATWVARPVSRPLLEALATRWRRNSE